MNLLDEARHYVARGWSVIPIRHRSRGKEPACHWQKYQSQLPTDRTLRRWFQNDVDGLAVVMGPVSGGLTCCDFDQLDAYDAWAGQYADLAAHLPTVDTARGRHVYFTSTVDRIIHTGDGEIRGGGYCLLPPSRHPTGDLYRWRVRLPNGPLPTIDPFAIGLAPGDTELSLDVGAEGDGGLSQELTVEEAIQATLPNGPGQRNHCVFRLARALKAVPGLEDAEPADLRPIVREWHRMALPVIRTQEFDETWSDFLYAWKRVKAPWGTNRLLTAWSRAKNAPLPAEAETYDTPGVRLLVALCRQLQVCVGDAAFFLSCRIAAKLLECTQMTVYRWLNMLVVDGVICVAEAGRPGRGGKATRFRYLRGL